MKGTLGLLEDSTGKDPGRFCMLLDYSYPSNLSLTDMFSLNPDHDDDDSAAMSVCRVKKHPHVNTFPRTFPEL